MLTITADDMTSFAQPERLRESSERFVNFWVGALSPCWAPFFAASSFGLGAWALAQGLSKSEGVFSDLPLATRWPGFTPWLNASLAAEAAAKDAVEIVERAAGIVVPAVEDVAEMAPETAVSGLAAVTEPVTTLAEDLWPQLEKSAGIAIEQSEEAGAEAAQVLIDPVTEMPVVAEAVEAVAEPQPDRIEPRPIAKALAAAKKKPAK